MKTVLHIIVAALALALSCWCDTHSLPDLHDVSSHDVAQHQQQEVDDAALWSREASGTEQAEVLTLPGVVAPQAGRTHSMGGKQLRAATQLHHAGGCALRHRRNAHTGRPLAMLQAPMQHRVASRYYVIALRHIIC